MPGLGETRSAVDGASRRGLWDGLWKLWEVQKGRGEGGVEGPSMEGTYRQQRPTRNWRQRSAAHSSSERGRLYTLTSASCSTMDKHARKSAANDCEATRRQSIGESGGSQCSLNLFWLQFRRQSRCNHETTKMQAGGHREANGRRLGGDQAATRRPSPPQWCTMRREGIIREAIRRRSGGTHLLDGE